MFNCVSIFQTVNQKNEVRKLFVKRTISFRDHNKEVDSIPSDKEANPVIRNSIKKNIEALSKLCNLGKYIFALHQTSPLIEPKVKKALNKYLAKEFFGINKKLLPLLTFSEDHLNEQRWEEGLDFLIEGKPYQKEFSNSNGPVSSKIINNENNKRNILNILHEIKNQLDQNFWSNNDNIKNNKSILDYINNSIQLIVEETIRIQNLPKEKFPIKIPPKPSPKNSSKDYSSKVKSLFGGPINKSLNNNKKTLPDKKYKKYISPWTNTLASRPLN